MKDESWVEILAMKSDIGSLFVKYRQEVVEAFRQHVHLQGGNPAVFSVSDIKAYFANYLRPGTPTQKRVAAFLALKEEERRKTSPSRYETVDLQTGSRSYFGNPIPDDAPPRPSDNAVWSSELSQWIR